MKTTEKFKTVIEDYLTQTALSDAVFAPAFAKPTKNLTDCIQYILSEVKKTGECAFDDSEVFQIAVKYYHDDSITKPAHTPCRVVVNQPAKADLFSAPIEPAPAIQKIPIVETPKTIPATLTLFDL